MYKELYLPCQQKIDRAFNLCQIFVMIRWVGKKKGAVLPAPLKNY
jgi:hypothetical protein